MFGLLFMVSVWQVVLGLEFIGRLRTEGGPQGNREGEAPVGSRNAGRETRRGGLRTNRHRPARAANEFHFELHVLKLAVAGKEIEKADVRRTSGIFYDLEGWKLQITFRGLPQRAGPFQRLAPEAQRALDVLLQRVLDPVRAGLFAPVLV